MKKNSITIGFFLIIILSVVSTINLSAQKADFTGEWKLNKEKSVLAENQLFLSRITIQLKSDSLLTTRVYESGDGQEYPFDEKISLDGKDNKMVVYDMPRTSTATRSGSEDELLISSTTTFNGSNGMEDMTATEKWKVDPDSKLLTLDFTNKMSGNETKGTYFYEKTK